ncbi:hypothetical protein PAAG_06176 [Paracoccidioides lutzii Pb01]|uniref:Uncharacterized protein n=1 Tax=Paracoccidioides lutzii (strain ATCC MYA-826 / Pb01) TaxID=502779 RepID=C1H666_PARBA|nr:hypothetical protein PAAG_06176 [Paracoccidioides lutzii Pb01]EEH35129.2 hypothetical protein PAAG_06176 [Paracoccidioides lutzii Pb01]
MGAKLFTMCPEEESTRFLKKSLHSYLVRMAKSAINRTLWAPLGNNSSNKSSSRHPPVMSNEFRRLEILREGIGQFSNFPNSTLKGFDGDQLHYPQVDERNEGVLQKHNH